MTKAKIFLTPITRTTLTSDICRKLVNHLMRGDWTEGERIPAERELCQHLGVGRASLREALKALEIMGMIETRLGDGTFVCGRSEFLSRPLLWAITGSAPHKTRELVEARSCLEVEMAGLAAERGTPEDLALITRHLEEMREARDHSPRFLEADLGFHLAVGLAAHNGILLNALHLIRNLMRQWIGSTLRMEGVADEALDQHAGIQAAIRSRDRTRSREAMEFHLGQMARHLVEPAAGPEAEDFRERDQHV